MNNKCKDCMDFDPLKKECTIRYTIRNDKTKTPMKRKPNQKGCRVMLAK